MRVIGERHAGAFDEPSYYRRCCFHADLLADYRAHDQLEAGPRAGYAQTRHGSRERREPRIAAEMGGNGGRIGLKIEHARQMLADRFRMAARRAFQRCDEARFGRVTRDAERAGIAEPFDCSAISTVLPRFVAE